MASRTHTVWIRRHGCVLLVAALGVSLLVTTYYLVAIVSAFVSAFMSPPEFVAIEGRVRDCLAKKEFDAALKHADLGVERFGNSFATGHSMYYLRAVVHARRNDLTSAIRDLTAAIAWCEEWELWARLSTTVARGRCFEEDGMLEAAGDDYQTVYRAWLREYAQHNQDSRTDQRNYMDVIQFFWSARQPADEDFAFEQLSFEKHESYRDTKRARQEAVLQWLLEFVEVHPKIVANIHDVDAKVFSLQEDDQ